MIEISRIDHISMAVAELDPQIEIMEGLFGFRPLGKFTEPGYLGMNLAVPGSSQLGWELLMPDGPESYIHRFLASENGPGLHHVTIQVPDVRDAASALRERGIQPWGYRERDEDGDGEERAENGAPRQAPEARPAGDRTRGVTYVHPQQGGHGFLFQIYAGNAWYTEQPFEDDGPHSLGIIAVNHLAHAHEDRDELALWYERVFGFRPIFRSPLHGNPDGFLTSVLEVPGGQMRWEIIQPAGPTSFVQRFLDQRGTSMHHVTFEVGDWQRAVEACAHHGVPIFGERAGETEGVRWREAFIHPRHTGGLLVQFFWQARPGVWI